MQLNLVSRPIALSAKAMMGLGETVQVEPSHFCTFAGTAGRDFRRAEARGRTGFEGGGGGKKYSQPSTSVYSIDEKSQGKLGVSSFSRTRCLLA